MLIQRLIACAITAAFASVAFTSSAVAVAVGAQLFNEGTVDTPVGSYEIPRGELDHGITGRGLNIVSEKAGFTSVAPICNWSVRYSHIDLSGTEYRSAQTPLKSDCDINTQVRGVR
jgi:hypothetical protein